MQFKPVIIFLPHSLFIVYTDTDVCAFKTWFDFNNALGQTMKLLQLPFDFTCIKFIRFFKKLSDKNFVNIKVSYAITEIHISDFWKWNLVIDCWNPLTSHTCFYIFGNSVSLFVLILWKNAAWNTFAQGWFCKEMLIKNSWKIELWFSHFCTHLRTNLIKNSIIIDYLLIFCTLVFHVPVTLD